MANTRTNSGAALFLGLIILVTLTLTLSANAQPPTQVSAPDPPWLKAKPQVVEAWKDMRFGMFVCWGPVTLTGLEIGWSRGTARPDQKQGGGGPTPVDVYDSLYKKWHPDQFDAREWVKVARDAGARYIIFLVKHHDGFCLYDTKLTDYRSTGPESAWKVDVLKAVAEACHDADIKLIVYYSQPDWHHPDYRTENHGRYIQYFQGQVREILTNYGRIDGLWFDLGGTPQDWDSENLFKMARGLQPDLIINNRCGLPGDFETPEQSLGGFQTGRPWETCMTLGTQWSWKPDDTIKSLKECIDALVTCAIRDGNLALNTNPMPDGRIEPRQADRFREIGQWLAKYGESIYGTRGGPFRALDERVREGDSLTPGGRWWGGSAHKGNAIYLHILRWPDDTISLPAIPRRIVASSLLNGGSVSVKQSGQGIEVGVAAAQRDQIDTIVKLDLDGPAADIPPARNPSGSLTFGKKVSASSVWGPDYEPEKACDDDDTATRWGAAPDSRSGWLEVDIGAETTFSRAVIDETGWDRLEAFELQSWHGTSWQTFVQGTQHGRVDVKFNPVTARRVRLNILKAKDVPTIWEFQLFKD